MQSEKKLERMDKYENINIIIIEYNYMYNEMRSLLYFFKTKIYSMKI